MRRDDERVLADPAFDETLRIIREEEPPTPSARFTSSASLASIAANRREEPRKLATFIAGDLDWIVMRAMEKDRTRRYETASALADDVTRCRSGELRKRHPTHPVVPGPAVSAPFTRNDPDVVTVAILPAPVAAVTLKLLAASRKL